MLTRKASAQWKGSTARGNGTMKVAGHTLKYSVPSRFEDGEAEGTNPEELIGAAHAGCFSMALAGILTRAKHEVRQLDTTAEVSIEKEDGGWEVKRVALTVRGDVEGIDDEQFVTYAEEAKANCPISKALASVDEITLDAALR